MQKPLPNISWLHSTTATGSYAASPPPSADITNTTGDTIDDVTRVQKLVSENPVMVFGPRGCCMCHVVKRLLLGLGVNPTIFYVDEEGEAALIDELTRMIGVGEVKDGRPIFPAIFVGGKVFGGLERVMAAHISGELVPILREAGALWL